MKIAKDHLYYGAAVIQIAEHPSFTAINEFQHNNQTVRCAYWVNQDLGVYLKYRTNADRQMNWNGKLANEYLFVFNDDARRHLKRMGKRSSNAFVGFVCVEDEQICCITLDEFNELIERRRKAKRKAESQYTIVVALPKGSSFRVHVTPPNTRNRVLGKALIIPRKDFPKRIFE